MAIRQRISSALNSVSSLAVSALAWFLGLSMTGLALIVTGVYLLLGVGPAFVSAGVSCLVVAAFIRKGMS